MFDKTTLDRLYRYCLSLTHAPDTAYDLLQTSMEKFLRKQQSDQLEAPVGYLYRIARNTFVDEMRQKKVRPTDAFDDEAPPLTNVLANGFQTLEDLMIDRQTVVRLMSELRAEDRELLYLWAVEGYTVQEVADQTGTPRGTLLSRIHRLRRKIQTAVTADADTLRRQEVV